MSDLETIGITLIVSGIVYLGYAFFTRNKKSVYFSSVVIHTGKEREYLNLQLAVSIFNGILLIIGGLTAFQYAIPIFYYTSLPLLVHLINFITKLIAQRKGFLKDI